MEGPGSISRLPLLAHARVEGYDAATHSVYITLPSMQEVFLPVRVLINGPADASRIEQQPLPVMGTWGLVAFPYGTVESAVWLGSFYFSPVNAVTTSSPPTDQDSQTKYMSHASGTYSVLDYIGQYFYRAPEGSNVILASGNVEPTTYRHSIDSEGVQTLQRFTDSDRNSKPPKPFYAAFNHPSGSSFTIVPSGDITLLEGNGTQAQVHISSGGTMLVQGGKPNLASVTITPSGVITIQTGSTNQGQNVGPVVVLDPQAKTMTLTGEDGKSIIKTDGTGKITIQSADTITVEATNDIVVESDSGNVTVKAAQQVNIQGNGGNIFLNTQTHTDSVDNIINTFNAHVHSGVTSGTSNTGTPTTVLP